MNKAEFIDAVAARAGLNNSVSIPVNGNWTISKTDNHPGYGRRSIPSEHEGDIFNGPPGEERGR